MGGRAGQTDRDKATVSHTPGCGPTQATEGDKKPEESLLPKAQTPELQDPPQREIEARGPETMYRERGREEGMMGEEVKRERQGEDRKERREKGERASCLAATRKKLG